MKKNFLIITILSLTLPFSLHAAKFYIDAPKAMSNGGESLVKVMVDTGADKINAVSGTITVDKSGLSIANIYDGDSSIVLWLTRPILDEKTMTISFSGLTPGGFQGIRTLFSFSIKSSLLANFSIDTKDMVALKNDGLGTSVKVEQKSSRIIVRKDVSTSTVDMNDTTPPEIFSPILSRSPDISENDIFVSFATVDKGVGIDHYEYASSWFKTPKTGSWIIAESPFILPKSDSSKLVFIKAVDRNGNERIGYIASKSYYTILAIWFIIGLLFLCVLLIFSRRHLRSHS